jgi:hypothetical protein
MASTTRDLAELIYVQMAARVPPDAAKTDVKAAEAVARFAFRMAAAFFEVEQEIRTGGSNVGKYEVSMSDLGG